MSYRRFVADGGDCDDTVAAVNPGAVEICGDGLDNNCDASAGSCGWAGEVALEPIPAIRGQAPSDRLGLEVVALGDTDGDGYADLWIGSPGWGDSGDIGAAWLVHGPISATTVITDADAWKITGASSGDGVGWRVAAGDLTGDGVVDLLTSAPGLDDGSGAVLVVVGPQSSDVDAADATPIWGNTLDNLGQDVLLADMDGDGHLDLVLGAPGTSVDHDSAGFVAVLPGPVTDPVNLYDAPTRLAGDQGGERVGSAVSAGDVNADGHVDLFIGAEGWDATRGRAFLVLGPIEGSHDLTETHTDAWFPGHGEEDRVGGEAEILGDLDGDGFLELGLGGWGASDEAGVAYVLPGGAGL